MKFETKSQIFRINDWNSLKNSHLFVVWRLWTVGHEDMSHSNNYPKKQYTKAHLFLQRHNYNQFYNQLQSLVYI